MNYKELIKMVHPDLNPNVVDAGVKVSEIMKNKNNPSELMRLAIQWGLINSSSNTNYNTQKTSNQNDYLWLRFNYVKHCSIFKSGMKIRFKDTRGTHEGWFIKATKKLVYFTNGKGIFTINSSLENLNEKFEICRSRIGDLYTWEIKKWKNAIIEIRKNSSKKSLNKVTFDSLGLEPNKYYYGAYIVTYREQEYELIKTNTLCAFINYNGEEKRILLKSITKIRKR